MRDYELVVVIDPNLDEEQIESVLNRLHTQVAQRGGSVLGTDAWGRRRLAYPIGKLKDGIYVLNRMQIPPESAMEIEHQIRLIEPIIRFLLVRVEDTGAPVAQAAAAPA